MQVKLNQESVAMLLKGDVKSCTVCSMEQNVSIHFCLPYNYPNEKIHSCSIQSDIFCDAFLVRLNCKLHEHLSELEVYSALELCNIAQDVLDSNVHLSSVLDIVDKLRYVYLTETQEQISESQMDVEKDKTSSQLKSNKVSTQFLCLYR